MDKNIDKNTSTKLSDKCSKKLLDYAKRSATDALKTTSKKSNSKNSRSKLVI